MCYDWDYTPTPPPPDKALIYCKDVGTSLVVQKVLIDGNLSCYASFPLTPGSLFDIGVLQFEPRTPAELTYYHEVFLKHLKPGSPVITVYPDKA